MTRTHWLTAERIRLYSAAVMICLGSIVVHWIASSTGGADTQGRPLGADFITFWGASYLGLQGHAQDAYDVARIYAAEQVAVPALKMRFAWFYPPAFHLMVLPLALLPYLLSYLAFILSTLAAYVAVLRQLVRTPLAMWCLAGFSGVWLNAVQGQNAFLTAAIAGAALINLERRPALAGALVGLLAIKPHLAMLFPLALLAIGAWRAIGVAAATAIGVTALSVAILGPPVGSAFLAGLHTARDALESGALPWTKMPSVFASLRVLGVPLTAAYAAHLMAAFGGAALVWHVWHIRADAALRNAILMTATFFASPYVYDYDLAWLAFPAAWYVNYAKLHGWRRHDREILVCAWLLPVGLANLHFLVTVPVGPPILCALLYVFARRAYERPSTQ
jgi:hypothetical protein